MGLLSEERQDGDKEEDEEDDDGLLEAKSISDTQSPETHPSLKTPASSQTLYSV